MSSRRQRTISLARSMAMHIIRKTANLSYPEIGMRLGHWVRAQLLVCLFYGTCFGIGLGLLGVPYAFALGLAAGFMELSAVALYGFDPTLAHSLFVVGPRLPVPLRP